MCVRGGRIAAAQPTIFREIDGGEEAIRGITSRLCEVSSGRKAGVGRVTPCRLKYKINLDGAAAARRVNA